MELVEKAADPRGVVLLRGRLTVLLPKPRYSALISPFDFLSHLSRPCGLIPFSGPTRAMPPANRIPA